MSTLKYTIFVWISLVSLFIFSCEVDNYDIPTETLHGRIIDVTTGEMLQTDAGSGTRIRLDELSWSDNPTPLYFWVKQDGTYQNTKLFKGTYRISPIDGPFVPLLIQDDDGNIVSDGRKTVDVFDITMVDFQVEPFLTVTWLKEPYVDATGHIAAEIKFERGTSNTDFHYRITDVYMFIAPNTYVGNSNFDNVYSTQIVYSGVDGFMQLGKPITIKSQKPMPRNRDFYVRIGARTDDKLQKKYNYTDIKQIVIP